MPIYIGALPDTDEPYLAGRVERWLINHGYAIGEGGVSIADDTVIVDCDRDPRAEIAAYQPTELEDERLANVARAELKGALDAIRAKAPANRTPAERAILAIAVLVRAT